MVGFDPNLCLGHGVRVWRCLEGLYRVGESMGGGGSWCGVVCGVVVGWCWGFRLLVTLAVWEWMDECVCVDLDH